MEIRKLVNEVEVGIGSKYTGRHLSMQFSSHLAVLSVAGVASLYVVFFCVLQSCSTHHFWLWGVKQGGEGMCLTSQNWKADLSLQHTYYKAQQPHSKPLAMARLAMLAAGLQLSWAWALQAVSENPG